MFSASRMVLRSPALLAAACVAALCVGALSTRAGESVEMTITIKDHKFEPAQIKVAAGTPIKLTVKNLDPTPEEFESLALQVEKIIPGKGWAIVRLRPLAKGTYPFVGEYHAATAKGTVIVE